MERKYLLYFVLFSLVIVRYYLVCAIMSGNFNNKRKFNSSNGREGFQKSQKGGGMRTPRSHNKNDHLNKKSVVEDEDNVPAAPAPVLLGSDPNEWFKRLQPKHIKSKQGVKSTVSIAFPSSIVRYAQSRELKTYLVGQIARACSMHEIDEVIIFVDSPTELLNDPEKGPSVFICKLLQYLEAPSYLRKDMFPVNYHLKYAGLLPPLDMPHHMRKDDVSLYREGVVIESNNIGKNHSLVNIGLSTEAVVNFSLPAGTRLTVKLSDLDNKSKKTETEVNSSNTAIAKYIPGDAVAPNTPRSEHGLYWGYQVRLAKSFSAIYSESPYLEEYNNVEESNIDNDNSNSNNNNNNDDGLEMNFINPDSNSSSKSRSAGGGVVKPKGYDVTIGYSEKGSMALDEPSFELKPFNHMLIVFGGMSGIEACIDADETMGHGVHGRDAPKMFDYWLNTCPSQGSRLTRTEEAALVTLARLRPHIKKVRDAVAK